MLSRINKSNTSQVLTRYYTNYYKDQLGLPDWSSRVELRLNEEETYCKRFIEWFKDWFEYDFTGKKVLVVGCGTGGELVNFHHMGADVYGVEPNEEAFEICLMKAKHYGMPTENICMDFSESIPFEEETFDFIYCSTVLEHVNDVHKSVGEMVRCVRSSGRIFIEVPDYRQWYEPHYKLPLPMFMPMWVIKLLLLLLRRPVSFIDNIKQVNSRILTNIFMEYPVTIFRVIHPWPEEWLNPRQLRTKVI